jgi:hypothetical protein
MFNMKLSYHQPIGGPPDVDYSDHDQPETQNRCGGDNYIMTVDGRADVSPEGRVACFHHGMGAEISRSYILTTLAFITHAGN